MRWNLNHIIMTQNYWGEKCGRTSEAWEDVTSLSADCCDGVGDTLATTHIMIHIHLHASGNKKYLF